VSAIWHVGAWNRNFGDWVVYDSIHYHLNRAASRDLYFVPLDSQRTRFSKAMIRKMNKEACMLLIGGGGLIFNRPEDRSVSGWQFNISLENIEGIQIPLVVYGIGYNKFPFDRAEFSPVLNEHLRAVQKKAALFSVRNTGSRDELLRRGLDETHMQVIMDAGAFAPRTDMEIPGLEPGRDVIGLNIAGDRPEHRFPEPADSNASVCYEVLAHALARIVRREKAQVLLLPHIVNMDELTFELFKQIIGPSNIVNLIDALSFMYPPNPVYASFLVGAYARCDIVIGMRGHSCIIPYGCGKPFMPFGSHPKNKFLLTDIGLPQQLLSTDDIIEGTLTVDGIVEKVTATLRDRDLIEQSKTTLGQARCAFDQWNNDVVSILY